jgi:hypothetical protein
MGLKTFKRYLEEWDSLNEDVDSKLKAVSNKIKNVALASILGLGLLASGCTAQQKEAVYNAYNDARNSVERTIDDMRIPEKLQQADKATADFILQKYGGVLNKELEKLPLFERAVIKAKVAGYMIKIGLTEDGTDTKKIIKVLNYTRKLIKEAKKKY